MLVAEREHRLLEGAALDLSEEGRNFLEGGQNGSVGRASNAPSDTGSGPEVPDFGAWRRAVRMRRL
jgi:hypothetical protein